VSQDDLSLLLQQLKHPDPQKRLEAVADLLDRRDARAVDALLESLKDVDYRVRAWSASALGWIGDPRSAGAIAELLTESPQADWDTRINPPMCACFALALLRQTEPILPLLQHSDEHVRSLAVIALRYIGDRAILPNLQTLAENDPSTIVRDEAVDAIEAMRSSDFIPLWQQFLD